MSLFPDSSALRSRARNLDGYADDLRRRAASLASTAHSTAWVSLAAGRFRGDVGEIVTAMVRAADGVDAAAAALRAHANNVDQVETALLRDVEAAAKTVGGGISHLVSGAGHLVGGAAHLVGCAAQGLGDAAADGLSGTADGLSDAVRGLSELPHGLVR
jgi:hypothetical protein